MLEPKGLALVVELKANVFVLVVVGAPKAGVAVAGLPNRLVPVFPNTLLVCPNPEMKYLFNKTEQTTLIQITTYKINTKPHQIFKKQNVYSKV